MSGGRWAGLGEPIMFALRRAYGSAFRGRAPLIGTIDVLAHATARAKRLPLLLDPSVLAELRGIAESPAHPSGRYGPGETIAATPPDPEVEALLREVEWRVRRVARRPVPERKDDPDWWEHRPRWTPAARAQLAGTLAEAREHGVGFAGLGHLLLATLRLRDLPATRYLAANDVRRAEMIASVARDRTLGESSAPYPEPSPFPAEGRGLGARIGRAMSRLTRLDGFLLASTEDIKAQAVRLDHDVAGAGHALLALLRVDASFTATGAGFAPPRRARNHAAALLREAGLDPHRLDTALAPPPNHEAGAPLGSARDRPVAGLPSGLGSEAGLPFGSARDRPVAALRSGLGSEAGLPFGSAADRLAAGLPSGLSPDAVVPLGPAPDRLVDVLPPDPSPEAVAEQVEELRRGDPFLADELLRAGKRTAEISLHHHHAMSGTTHYLLALLEAPTAGPLLDACGVDGDDLRARATALLSAIPSAWS
ncbi:Clp protease N-terminal domain-containing protein [Asanoa ishikariensis]|nr:Clp protease N-terminal domain-containing protein [Asanoa ishikariensis]